MNDLLKDITINLVNRLERPKEKKKVKRKANFTATEWFGMVPCSIKVSSKRFKNRVNKIKPSK